MPKLPSVQSVLTNKKGRNVVCLDEQTPKLIRVNKILRKLSSAAIRSRFSRNAKIIKKSQKGINWHACQDERTSLQWRHDERYSVSNHQRLDCFLIRLFRRRSKKTSKLRIAGLCEGKPPVTGEFPAQRASNAKNAFIWWRHHVKTSYSVRLASGYHNLTPCKILRLNNERCSSYSL